MLEQYLCWMKRKFNLNSLERIMQVNEGEVYWCSLGLNVGDEENGKGEMYRRPVLVVRKFNKNIFIGIPLSTKLKENPYYIRVLLKNIEQAAMISQIRIIDVKRLDEKIGYIRRMDMQKVKTEIRKMFE